MIKPFVTTAPAPGADTTLVHVRLGDLVRHFEVATERLKDRLVAVLVSEFGMAQPDAHTHADVELAAQPGRRDAGTGQAEKAADYDRLAAAHGDAQQLIAALQDELRTAQNAAMAAQDERDRTQAENDALRAEVEKLSGHVDSLTGQVDQLTAPPENADLGPAQQPQPSAPGGSPDARTVGA